jgi:hypothetical protein
LEIANGDISSLESDKADLQAQLDAANIDISVLESDKAGLELQIDAHIQAEISL